jgi:hypothetical protein
MLWQFEEQQVIAGYCKAQLRQHTMWLVATFFPAVDEFQNLTVETIAAMSLQNHVSTIREKAESVCPMSGFALQVAQA